MSKPDHYEKLIDSIDFGYMVPGKSVEFNGKGFFDAAYRQGLINAAEQMGKSGMRDAAIRSILKSTYDIAVYQYQSFQERRA
jgi:hypothetical protein